MKTIDVVIAVWVVRNGCLLLGERLGSYAGHLGDPGGKVEFGESFEEAASRELLEETGLVCSDFTQVCAVADIHRETDKHYVVVFMLAHGVVGEPELKEPDKCAGWKWCDPGNAWFDRESLLRSVRMALDKHWLKIKSTSSYFPSVRTAIPELPSSLRVATGIVGRICTHCDGKGTAWRGGQGGDYATCGGCGGTGIVTGG